MHYTMNKYGLEHKRVLYARRLQRQLQLILMSEEKSLQNSSSKPTDALFLCADLKSSQVDSRFIQRKSEAYSYVLDNIILRFACYDIVMQCLHDPQQEMSHPDL